MKKNVFTPQEITKGKGKVMLQLAKTYEPEEDKKKKEEAIPEYTGPTADDLRREAEEFKAEWEKQKAQMLENAQGEAEEIIKRAEENAFEEVRRKTDEASIIRQQAATEAEDIIRKAEERAKEITQEAELKRDKITGDAYKDGFDKGSEDGYSQGKQEAQRLVDRLHTILEKTIDKRQEILDETEQQIVELVLLISRKVVKTISENQRSVVMQNILQALRKVKGRGEVTIRVNLADLDLTTEHTKDFMQAVESVKNITVAEDSSVERGGCIIETDFGAIDARISSQMNELEQKILEISPIKTVNKTVAMSE